MTKGMMVNFINDFDRAMGLTAKESTYPKYNIAKTEDGYIIEIAVLGLTKEELEVEFRPGVLEVRAQKRIEKSEYLEKSLSSKAFSKRFITDPSLVVDKVTLELGILSIALKTENQNKNLLEIL